MTLPLKRTLARQHFVEHRTQRKNVAPSVELFSFDLLRRHVLKSADNGALLRHRRRACRGSRERRSRRQRNRCFCQAKVEQLCARLCEHDVAGFQIAMNDAGAVGFVKCVGDFHAVLQYLRERQRAFLQ